VVSALCVIIPFAWPIIARTISYVQVSHSSTVLTVVTHRRTAVLRKPTHYLALHGCMLLPSSRHSPAVNHFLKYEGGVCGGGFGAKPPPQEKQVYKPRFVQLVLCEVPHSRNIHVKCRGFIHRLSQTHGR